jgi:hypothetical protein
MFEIINEPACFAIINSFNGDGYSCPDVEVVSQQHLEDKVSGYVNAYSRTCALLSFNVGDMKKVMFNYGDACNAAVYALPLVCDYTLIRIEPMVCRVELLGVYDQVDVGLTELGNIIKKGNFLECDVDDYDGGTEFTGQCGDRYFHYVLIGSNG